MNNNIIIYKSKIPIMKNDIFKNEAWEEMHTKVDIDDVYLLILVVSESTSYFVYFLQYG